MSATARSRSGCWCAASNGSTTATGNWAYLYARSVIFGLALFAILTAIPILGKWLLVGRWKADGVPDLEPALFPLLAGAQPRSQVNPMALFAGSPLYNLYLRLLGMRIGRDSVIATDAGAGLHRPDLDRRQHGGAARRDRCRATRRARA